jgi:hypothetical protein
MSKRRAQRPDRAFVTLCSKLFDMPAWLPTAEDVAAGSAAYSAAVTAAGALGPVVASKHRYIALQNIKRTLPDLGEHHIAEVAEAAAAAGIWRDAQGAAQDAPILSSLADEYRNLRAAVVSLCLLEPELFTVPAVDSNQIKTIIYSHPDFECGFENILFLLMHCLLKTSNECVVEGVGSVVDHFADVRRGSISAEVYTAMAPACTRQTTTSAR